MIRRQNRMKTSQIDAAMDILRSKGRYGDTELAHVNPREKAILKAMGGAGSRNPRTGLREYYDEGGGMSSDGMGAPGSVGTGDVGLGEGTNVGAEGLGTNATGVDYGASFGPEQPTTMQNVMGYIGQTLEDPNAIPGMGLIGQVVGRSMSAMNRAAREAGYDVQDPISERAAFEAGFPGNRAGGDGLAMALGAVPVSAPTPRYLRGGEMAAPQEISSFIGPGMTDLQQRALISTYGTQGVNSAFRTDPVRRYYANLLSRGLISDRGTPVQNPYVLPIEQQYASMVLGRPMTNPSDAAAAYESIRELL